MKKSMFVFALFVSCFISCFSSNISTLVWSIVGSTAFANEIQSTASQTSAVAEGFYTPFDLAIAGFRGKFREQGIPSASRFCYFMEESRDSGAKLFDAALVQGLVSEADRTNGFLRSIRSLSLDVCSDR